MHWLLAWMKKLNRELKWLILGTHSFELISFGDMRLA
jgi:hypothetical protein